MESMDSPAGLALMADFNSSGDFLMDGLSVDGRNFSANFSEHSVPFQGSSSMVTAVISLTVFLLGLTGNTLAIYVVLRYAKMKTVTNIYIFNLAVADELYILGLPFLTTQNVLSYWPFGSFLCRVVMTADSLNQFTSIFCLTVMSIDRYLAVVHPIRFTKRRRSERKVTRMVVVIVVVFVLCWLPFFIINIVNLVVILPENSAMAGIYFFSVILSYANSCANPLLYGFLSDNFKQSFLKVLCVRKTNGVEDGDPSQPRTEKTTTHDTFLTPRNNDFNGQVQSSQVSPHTPKPQGTSPPHHADLSLHSVATPTSSHDR